MRKITRLAALAFRGGDNFKLGNTSVTHDGPTSITQMRLHGNLIAERLPGRRVRVTLAGWGTPTTRERVNGVLEMMGINAYFCQRNHEQHLSLHGNEPVPVSSSDWFEFE